jgi:hypothetical protein
MCLLLRRDHMLTEIAVKTNAFKEPTSNLDFWRGSLFESFWLMSSPKSKGARGERLAADIMESLGHDVLRNENGKPIRWGGSEHDIVVNDQRTEVKMSLTWGDAENQWTWQQIRDQDYDRIIFLGINPNDVRMWWATKRDLMKHVIGNRALQQHGGKKAASNTYWIRNKIPSWFREIETW